MKAFVTAVIAATSIATGFAQEPQPDSCKQSELNFVTNQEYENLLFSPYLYYFYLSPSKDAEVNIRGGSLELRLDSKWLELKSCFEHGEYSIAYRYVGYIESTQTYVCDSIGVHDQIMLLINRKNGNITRLYYFASFDNNGKKFVTYGEDYGGTFGGVIKVYEYIDGEYTCIKEIRDENWYPVEAYFYDDKKVIGKVRYYGDNKVGYFWFPVKFE